MALDEAILESVGRGRSPNTLRFLRFSPPAVLVGYHQSVEQEVRTEYCERHGIHVNRRITGGGAILFDEPQIGWELIASKEGLGVGAIVFPLFERICAAVISGLRELGVAAQFRPRNDIEIAGKKISGTGGTEEGEAFLFQGTLLTDFDIETMLRSLKIPLEKLKDKEIEAARDRVTCLKWELGHLPELEEIKGAIGRGFERTFGVRLEPGTLNAYERSLSAEKVAKFQSSGWVHSRKKPAAQQQMLRAVHKAEGGLIRTSLIYNTKEDRIKSILITGDFFAFPKRTIPDLEAALKDARSSEVRGIVTDFFESMKPTLPGMVPEDFLIPVYEALDKVNYPKYRVPSENVNEIFTVNGSLEEVADRDISLFLLPYCAKLPECKYRYEKECAECGRCSIGEAYRLGREKGLRTETIVSFEDLEVTLTAARREGVDAFIGSCCEPFYAKHKDDFEALGVPGILVDVDNTTCYELGEEQQAYLGQFERQTDLKLDLISTMLDLVNPRVERGSFNPHSETE